MRGMREDGNPYFCMTGLGTFADAMTVDEASVVKVETDDPGIFGWGECSLPTKPRGVRGAIADLEKLIAGADPSDIEWIWQRMYRHSYWRGGPILSTSISGIERRNDSCSARVSGQLGPPIRVIVSRRRAFAYRAKARERLWFHE